MIAQLIGFGIEFLLKLFSGPCFFGGSSNKEKKAKEMEQSGELLQQGAPAPMPPPHDQEEPLNKKLVTQAAGPAVANLAQHASVQPKQPKPKEVTPLIVNNQTHKALVAAATLEPLEPPPLKKTPVAKAVSPAPPVPKVKEPVKSRGNLVGAKEAKEIEPAVKKDPNKKSEPPVFKPYSAEKQRLLAKVAEFHAQRAEMKVEVTSPKLR